MPPSTRAAVSATVSLAGVGVVPLLWDKTAMFRADEIGVFITKGIGFARAAKYVWAMLPAGHRDGSLATPEAVAAVLPPLDVVWPAIDAAIKAAGDSMTPKNVFGSTSGRGPSSS